MTTAALEAYVEGLVDQAPPLDEETRHRLRGLLTSPGHDGGAATTAAPTSLQTPSPAAKRNGGRRRER